MASITTPHDLGLLVKAARNRSGLTQQQFADVCGVGRRFLSEFENGKPRLELGKVLQVLNAAGIDIEASLR
jgi:y4mF family transcriptional regulator